MDAAAELGTNPVSKHQIQPEYGDEQADARGQGNVHFSCSAVTTSRIGNLTWLIHTLLYVMTIHTYIHTYIHGDQKLHKYFCSLRVRGTSLLTYSYVTAGNWNARMNPSCIYFYS